VSATPFVWAPWARPWSVASVLVEGPTEEPLTLDQAKLRAGFEWAPGDERDTLLRGFIKAARQKVEHDTGLALLTQTRDIFVAATSNGLVPLPWQAMPVQSLTAIEGSVGFFTQDLVQRALHFEEGATLAAMWRVVAGWPSPAVLEAEAPMLTQAVGLLTAHYATLGRDLALLGAAVPVPHGYDACIDAYRVVWLP